MRSRWLLLLLLAGCGTRPGPPPPGPNVPDALVATASPPASSPTPRPPAKKKPAWAVLDEDEAPALPDWPRFEGHALESDTYPKSPPHKKLHTSRIDATSLQQQHLSQIAWRGPRADYREVDRKVARIGDVPNATLESLARALNATGQNEEEKFRAIYRWEAAHVDYDMDVFQGGEVVRSQWPTDVLRDRVAVCDGYARLYCALAQEMGLECETVMGFALGRLTFHNTWKYPNHRWVRVHLPGGWALVDPTWSRAYQGVGQFVYQDEYFLISPPRLLKDHWPVHPQWQLLTPPLTLEAFKTFDSWKPVPNR